MEKAVRSPVKEMVANIESKLQQTSAVGLYGWVKVNPEKTSAKPTAKCNPKLTQAKTMNSRNENTQSTDLTPKNPPLFKFRIDQHKKSAGKSVGGSINNTQGRETVKVLIIGKLQLRWGRKYTSGGKISGKRM